MPGKSHKMGNFTVSRPKRTRLSRITKICGVLLFGISGINWENQDCFYFFNEFPNLPFCDSWWPSFPAKKILNCTIGDITINVASRNEFVILPMVKYFESYF